MSRKEGGRAYANIKDCVNNQNEDSGTTSKKEKQKTYYTTQ